jgi:hypothetical protein
MAMPSKGGRGCRFRHVSGRRPFQDAGLARQKAASRKMSSPSPVKRPRDVVLGCAAVKESDGLSVLRSFRTRRAGPFPSHPDVSGVGVGTAEGGPMRFLGA